MAGGINTSGGGSGGRFRRSRRRQPMADINVTPLVDVMLVLLIIFMVTAPLLTVGVPLDLPETKANQLTGDKDPITISVTKDGKIFIQKTEMKLGKIVRKLRAIAKNGYKERIYVKGDKGTDYGTVMKLMATISTAGFTRLALVTAQES